jgi:uncharacterized protein YbjQ (UPF0145 family)
MPIDDSQIDWKKSLQQLQQGNLPIRAELRLADEAGPNKKLFTSDLSVNEFLASREVGVSPISQVMGSSIYHVGRIADYKGATGEITTLSQAHRDARKLALRRIWLEGKAVGADAVVGVRLGERFITIGSHGKGGDDGGEIIEFSVVGTAVKAPWLSHLSEKLHTVVTDLSGQQLWALYREGYGPCGVVFDFCRYHVWHVLKSWTGGGEVTSAVNAVETAKDMVNNRIMQQANQMGAEFVVGSSLEFKVKEVPCGYEGCELNDLDIDVSWFGTAICRLPKSTPAPQPIPPLILGMMKLGRKSSDELLEGESESDELKKLAEEVEKEASKE